MFGWGQEFFNLTADYADSVYTISIDYPEFIDMSEADVARLQKITARQWPALPEVQQYIGVSRRRGTLYVAFVPIVFRDGRYQKLVSFKLTVQGTYRSYKTHKSYKTYKSNRAYASHSVLATGRWAKIRVPASGVYQASAI